MQQQLQQQAPLHALQLCAASTVSHPAPAQVVRYPRVFIHDPVQCIGPRLAYLAAFKPGGQWQQYCADPLCHPCGCAGYGCACGALVAASSMLLAPYCSVTPCPARLLPTVQRSSRGSWCPCSAAATTSLPRWCAAACRTSTPCSRQAHAENFRDAGGLQEAACPCMHVHA